MEEIEVLLLETIYLSITLRYRSVLLKIKQGKSTALFHFYFATTSSSNSNRSDIL